MAAPYKPELFSIDSVIDFYDQADGIHFKVYGGTTPKPEYCRYVYDGNEKETGKQILEQALYGLKTNIDNTNPYLIQVFRKKKTKETEYPTPTQIVFQLNKPERYMPMMNGMAGMSMPMDNELKSMMGKMIEGQNLLISKISADEVEDDYVPEKPAGIMGLLQDDDFKQLAIAAVGAIFQKFTTPAPAPMGNTNEQQYYNQPQALAGIDIQASKASEAVTLLSKKDAKYGDHLLYLANLSDTQYKMLLSFIK